MKVLVTGGAGYNGSELVQEVVGGRKDYKIDCLTADFKDWEIS